MADYQYYDLQQFSTYALPDRTQMIVGVPQTQEKGYIVEDTNGNYDWRPDVTANDSGIDYWKTLE